MKPTPWRTWFAWHPVRLNKTGKFAWLKKIYIRENEWGTAEYGDIFDILSQPSSDIEPKSEFEAWFDHAMKTMKEIAEKHDEHNKRT